MSHDIPSSSPKDPTDLNKALDDVDAWSGQVLRIAREAAPSKEQEHFSAKVNDMLTRTMVRVLVSPQMSVELPTTTSFSNAAHGLKNSIGRMTEIAQFRGNDKEKDTYSELSASIAKLDMFDTFGRKSALIKLLETNAAFMAGPESQPSSVRTNIEDGAMELCSMFREILEENPESIEAILKEPKIAEDLAYVGTLYERLEDTNTPKE